MTINGDMTHTEVTFGIKNKTYICGSSHEVIQLDLLF